MESQSLCASRVEDPAALKSRSLWRLGVGAAVIASMLFFPAGTVRYWQGWVFTVVACLAGFFYFLYFLKRDPKLLERRLQSKEKLKEQRLIVRLGGLIFYPAFLIPGLDHRFGWSQRLLAPVPLWLTLLAQASVLASLGLFLWVMKTNSFASRTIQVEAGQQVVCSGPYRFARHPMYLGLILLYLCIPLSLGSYVALPAFGLLVPLIVFRLLSEEALLRQELPGYAQYCLRTRFRLVPLVW
jgi:protein-S-isoprenylcysteine O-methyltransferase Ste14